MEKFKLVIEWLLANKEILAGIVLGLLAIAELIVRLTPTEKDNGAVERVGAVIRKILDFLKVPNNIKKPE